MTMTPDWQLCRVVGESADRLVTSQIFMSGGGADPAVRNTNQFLYEAALAKHGAPLSYLAAKALIERLQPRDTVIICSGFFDPPSMITEGDGPISAALLGRALAATLGVTPVFLTEVTNMPRMQALVEAVGLEVLSVDLARTTAFKAAIAPLPIDPARAKDLASRFIAQVSPAAMICIEKPSPTAMGTYHVGSGIDVSSLVGKVDHFVYAAQDFGALTIGIGDGGNEAGMGAIADTVKDVVSTGKVIGSSVSTDILVVATIANWGAYAIEACLAAALHLPECIHSIDMERRVADAAAKAGMIDPMSGFAHGWVDGTPPVCSESILELLRQTVELRLNYKLRRHGMLHNGRRWHESDEHRHQIEIWSKQLNIEEQAYFAKHDAASSCTEADPARMLEQ